MRGMTDAFDLEMAEKERAFQDKLEAEYDQQNDLFEELEQVRERNARELDATCKKYEKQLEHMKKDAEEVLIGGLIRGLQVLLADCARRPLSGPGMMGLIGKRAAPSFKRDPSHAIMGQSSESFQTNPVNPPP